MARTTGLIALNPVVNGRACHLIAPRYEFRGGALIELEQRVSSSQHTDEASSFLLGHTERHDGALFSGVDNMQIYENCANKKVPQRV